MGTTSHSDKERLVWLSRLIWGQIVSPGWLDHDNASHKYGNNTRHKRDKARDKTRVLSHVVTLFSLAEATSPLLVGLICNRVLRFGVVGVVDVAAESESLASSHNCNCRYYVGTYLDPGSQAADEAEESESKFRASRWSPSGLFRLSHTKG
ncbi:hypothetical protein Pelo_19362 [Pelomyxa schiedti]|nr:hypothetical protein Pelo_19362 [Pelomyxa schiedti]